MKTKLTHVAYAALAAIPLSLSVYACAQSETSEIETEQPPGEDGGEDDGTSMGAGAGFGFGGGNQGEGGDENCVDLDLSPDLEQLPADIIFVIDNSGSMNDEILQVEQNINQNFATIIQGSGIDYRVIMITNHGDNGLSNDTKVCIGPPLAGSTDCTTEPPGEVVDQFYHYDIDVQSTDGKCIILDTLYGTESGGEADEWGLHPDGWVKWLRPEAVKVFVMITDDRISCTWNGITFNDGSTSSQGQQAATLFDNQLLGLAPLHFGTTADRNYLFYSIVGVPPNTNPLEAYAPTDPIIGGSGNTCSSAYAPGTGYQWLSKGTGALRFPVCNTQSYDVVFQDIAAGVIKGTSVPCEFELPAPDGGQTPDLDTVSVLFTPGAGPDAEFNQVESEAACGVLNNAFWIDEDVFPHRVHLCPNTCTQVEADNLAELKVRYQCGIAG